MESPGSFLREKRKSKGISLEQASEELRIKVTILEALEQGKDELLPGQPYKKIFLKAYADYLGLNFEELWAKFTTVKPKSKEKVEPVSEPPAREKEKQVEQICVQKVKPDYNFLLTLAGIALGAATILIFIIHQQVNLYNKVPETKKTEVRMGPSSPTPDSAKPEPETPSEPEGITLKLEGLEDTWAMVIGDEDTLFQGVIKNGMQAEYKARDRFKLTLGKSWGVNGYVNGEKLKPLGRKGKGVFGREISKDNYKDFLDTSAAKR